MNEPDPIKRKKLDKQVNNMDVAALDRCKDENVYERAFHDFSLGAFGGHLISLYKIGDK